MTDVELVVDIEKRELSFAADGPGFRRVQAVVRKSTSVAFYKNLTNAAAGYNGDEIYVNTNNVGGQSTQTYMPLSTTDSDMVTSGRP